MSGKLSDKYICPPLSVWDTRQDYWKKCKKQWDNLGLYSDNGRTNVLGNSQNVTQNSKTGYKTIAVNTSKFDPVIADIVYSFFIPQGGKCLDVFAGGGNKRRSCLCKRY